jgi:cobalamin biosynthesis protein CobT
VAADGDAEAGGQTSDEMEAAGESAAPPGAPGLGEADIAQAGMSASLPQADPNAAALPAVPGSETGRATPVLSLPLSTEFDRVEDLSGQGDAHAWRVLRNEARAETAALRNKLERALQADEWTHWRREQERGTMDRAALVRVATQPGYRTPFAVRRSNPGRDCAVTVLVDASGSMAGEKIALARRCAAALADALGQLGFPCEVLGYSSIESAELRALRDAQRAAGVDLKRFNRTVERLDLKVYKRFASPVLSGIARIECGHENPDGECLAWAAGRLADFPAQRRLMLVLSDGYPATGDGDPARLHADLHARIAALTASGIELIGIGVLDDAVETFYPEAVVVRSLAELPSTAFEVLSRRLLGHRRH